MPCLPLSAPAQQFYERAWTCDGTRDVSVEVGASTSTDPPADAVALWLGLHGLADQHVVAPSFRWPADITNRLISAQAHLSPPTPT